MSSVSTTLETWTHYADLVEVSPLTCTPITEPHCESLATTHGGGHGIEILNGLIRLGIEDPFVEPENPRRSHFVVGDVVVSITRRRVATTLAAQRMRRDVVLSPRSTCTVVIDGERGSPVGCPVDGDDDDCCRRLKGQNVARTSHEPGVSPRSNCGPTPAHAGKQRGSTTRRL